MSAYTSLELLLFFTHHLWNFFSLFLSFTISYSFMFLSFCQTSIIGILSYLGEFIGISKLKVNQIIPIGISLK